VLSLLRREGFKVGDFVFLWGFMTKLEERFYFT
jgi:hypothetical protein